MLNKLLYILLSMILPLMLTACSGEDIVDEDDFSDVNGIIVTQNAFQAGDEVTRSTLVYGNGGFKITWNVGDQFGMYATAKKPTTYVEAGETKYNFDGLINPNNEEQTGWAGRWHPGNTNKGEDGLYLTDETLQQQAKYRCTRAGSASGQAKIDFDEQTSENEPFDWDIVGGTANWTVYCPYKDFIPQKLAGGDDYQNYDALPFDFSNQTQNGFVDMYAYYKQGGYSSENYINSERAAAEHISKADVLISTETEYAPLHTYYHMNHLGAFARFFLLAPDKELTLVSLDLICESKIFYTQGTFDLTSHVYQSGKQNKGCHLVGDDAGDASIGNIQMHPAGEKTKNLTLKFGENMKIHPTTASNKYSNYLIAYLMMYPITYKQSEHGKLYAYVTAKDADGKEMHFLSEPLADKTMASGYYYQWTSRTHEQNGLYPIEMTATLQSWQEIVAGGINTDLEK